ncbi:MAG: MBL fold metallo-hydrolase [Myxococcaceae bacterium]
MSEALPGIPRNTEGVPRAREAAAVILVRGAASGVEVYWLRRGAHLSYAGGFYAFPGGRLDSTDAEIPVVGAEGQDAALRVAAARELLEETGVFIASGAEKLRPEEVAAARRDLLDKKRTFAQILDAHRLTLKAGHFLDAGRWITPTFLPSRFDARFFLVEAPRHANAELWPGELAEGAWISPAHALARWDVGSALLHPPNLHALRTLTTYSTVEDAAARLRQQPHCTAYIPTRIEFQRGIRLFPLETPTLPPATHTNSYVVGNGELLIVDPGAAEVRQYARLLALVTGLSSEGLRPKAVFLTHHHADHVGGAVAVSERLKIPIWCHEQTANRLPIPAQRLLKEGEEIVLQGVPSMKLTVLHTPGHARGHLCLIDAVSKAGIVGDMVAGVGTILIDPPEGDMIDYLAQLERLRELPVTTLYPAHGSPMPDGVGKLTQYISHRELREKKVLESIPADGGTIAELVPRAYADIPEVLYPLAERSLQAILIKLVRQNRVSRKEDRYFTG